MKPELQIHKNHILKGAFSCGFLFIYLSFSAQITNPNSPAFKPEYFYKKQAEREQQQTATTIPIPTNKGFTADDIIRQTNESAMRQMGYNPPVVLTKNNPFPQTQLTQSRQQNELKNILDELEGEQQEQSYVLENQEKNKITASYQAVYAEIMKMYRNEIPFSLKRAVFMVENVYCNYSLDYTEFNKMIQNYTDAIHFLMAKEKIDLNNHLGKNYLFQKFFSQTVTYQDKQKITKTLLPFGYDFEDYTGLNDWKKMFVWKLLKTGKGQCHSLPLLYLILAEETNTQAWLTLAPEHSFIQFRDDKEKKWYNFETTNAHVVSTDLIIESGYITSEAIKNKIYLDTLSRQGIISTLLADLTMGYIDKNGYDEFVVTVIGSLENICPNNIQVYLLKADLMTLTTQTIAVKYKNPPLEKMANYPELYQQFKSLNAMYDKIDNLGYVKMPDEMYQVWLASLNREKEKANAQKGK